MNHKLFPQEVTLQPEKHKYFDKEGNEYLSVSKLLKMLAPKFEDSFAYRNASEEKRAEWAATRDAAGSHGSNVHSALELFSETKAILAENLHLESVIRSVSAHYGEYHSTINEVALYSKEYRIAGTTDKICIINSGKSCDVDIADFKTYGKDSGMTFDNKYKTKLYPPFDYLHDCDFVKCVFQLSLYAWMFEGLTGRKVRKIFVHFIPKHNPMEHKIIPLYYARNDVKLLLETHRENIRTELGLNQVLINEEEEF